MNPPKINGLYKDKEGNGYYVITSFRNPNINGIRVEFKIPGTNRIFRYDGLVEVADFLEGIRLVQQVPSELEEITKQEQKLNHQLHDLKKQKSFLEQYAQSQPKCTAQLSDTLAEGMHQHNYQNKNQDKA